MVQEPHAQHHRTECERPQPKLFDRGHEPERRDCHEEVQAVDLTADGLQDEGCGRPDEEREAAYRQQGKPGRNGGKAVCNERQHCYGQRGAARSKEVDAPGVGTEWHKACEIGEQVEGRVTGRMADAERPCGVHQL